MFHETARQQGNAAVIEAQKPFAAKRLETYEKLATLTAEVAQPGLPDQARRAKRQELDQIVNGQLALWPRTRCSWRFVTSSVARTAARALKAA